MRFDLILFFLGVFLLAAVFLYVRISLADKKIVYVDNYLWRDTAYKTVFMDPYGAFDFLSFIAPDVEIIVNQTDKHHPTGIVTEINAEIFKQGATGAKGKKVPDIQLAFKARVDGKIEDCHFVIEQQHDEDPDLGYRALKIVSRIVDYFDTGLIIFCLILTGIKLSPTTESRSIYPIGKGNDKNKYQISISIKSFEVMNMILEELRANTNFFVLIFLAGHLRELYSHLKGEEGRVYRKQCAKEVLDRAEFLAKLHNVDINRLNYVFAFVYSMFIANDEVLVNWFREEYMAIYSAEEFQQKVLPSVIIGYHVTNALKEAALETERKVSEAVSEAAREMAKELIRLSLPLKEIAKVTKLSLKIVESIKAEIDGAKPADPPK